VSLPTLTLENGRTSDSKVFVHTGIPRAITFTTMFDELEPEVGGKKGEPR